MKFSQTRPVKIVMLGAGGTGGHIAPHLYRLLYSLERPVRFIICDGDVVEEKNLVRQNFIQADLGENKAKVLAERYSTVFGLETEYVPSFVEKEDDLRRLLKPDHWRIDRAKFIWEQVILIGAVDNNKSRQLCHCVFQEAKELIYIDSGNGEYTGQVVCGIRRGGKKEIGFNLHHMADALRQFKGEPRVRMKFRTPASPILLEADGRSDCALVLPVRLKTPMAAAA